MSPIQKRSIAKRRASAAGVYLFPPSLDREIFFGAVRGGVSMIKLAPPLAISRMLGRKTTENTTSFSQSFPSTRITQHSYSDIIRLLESSDIFSSSHNYQSIIAADDIFRAGIEEQIPIRLFDTD